MWVARDKDGSLCIHGWKPTRNKNQYGEFWDSDDAEHYEISEESIRNTFKKLKWEDDPLEVNIIPTHIDMTEDLIPFIYNYGTEAHDELIRIFEKYLGNNRLK